jgi:two-component system, NtrC family, nitrogen regulation response regulator GlnG
MGKILVIDDDRDIRALIEKIFPNESLRVIETLPPSKEGAGAAQRSVLHTPSLATREEAVRAFLREEVTRSSWGSIHDKVIGKIEKELIGMILEEERGNQVRASKRLGINRNTLRKKMRDLQIITRVVTGGRGN